jgi:predicted O-methyltransferase YrrM
MQRHRLLKTLHERLRPRNYLEIGVANGRSMTLSRSRSIGIDPAFRITSEILCDLHLARSTSDEFFARRQPLAHFDQPVIDLAFIDGMHLAEYALRDLINVERHTSPASVIVIDDMLPRTVAEADRDRGAIRQRGAWAGDVYKLTESARRLRPDLVWLEVDTQPTGTVVVLVPDRDATGLSAAYDDLVEEYVVADPQPVPDEVLKRSVAVAPERLLAAPIWDALRGLRDKRHDVALAGAREVVREAGLLSG